MKLHCEDYDQLTVMSIRGELTGEQTDVLQQEALDRLRRNVHDFVLDLTAMEFIDSKGLETLLWLQEQAAEKLGQVRLASPRDNVEKILEITRLTPRFDTHVDVDAAIKSLR